MAKFGTGNETIRRMLQQALKAAIPTQPQLARMAGVSYSALRSYRRGERLPPAAVLRRLAQALGVQGKQLVRLAAQLERAAAQPTKGRKP